MNKKSEDWKIWKDTQTTFLIETSFLKLQICAEISDKLPSVY